MNKYFSEEGIESIKVWALTALVFLAAMYAIYDTGRVS